MSFINTVSPTGGTNVFLKIEGDLQAMCDAHHLASRLFPLPLGLGRVSPADGTKEFFHQAHSQHFLLLTYEDAMGAGE